VLLVEVGKEKVDVGEEGEREEREFEREKVLYV
jgi:hypothetical protein